jgi:hypothetical protein
MAIKKKLSMATVGSALIFLGAAFANAAVAKADQSTLINPITGDNSTGSFPNRSPIPNPTSVDPSQSDPKIAIFGDNSIDDFLNTQPGFSATVVTDANLATPGFLDAFDVFLYTRDDASFGTGLSAAAAANVKSFVTGNVVLFLTDLADRIGPNAPEFPGEDLLADKALLNGVTFAAQNGKGYVGEFNGAGLALSSNTSGFFDGQALGLVPGTFTSLGFNPTQPFDIIQTDNPVVAGLPNPWTSTGAQDFLAGSTGIPSQFIVAVGPAGGSNQFPTIVATMATQSVPESSSVLGVLSVGAIGAGSVFKRKHQQKA